MNGRNAEALKALYVQIEEICRYFKEIRSEASGIIETSQMPDAALHLNDVLQATEEAAITILEAATAIGGLAEDESISPQVREKIAEQVGKIYEASSFQDISGQRIKKVLSHLNEMEEQLQRLSELARGQAQPKKRDPLLNGPSLNAQAPSQAEIDKLFGSS